MSETSKDYLSKYSGEQVEARLDRIYDVPTLDHIPGANDLSFTDSEGTHTFRIGDSVRVADGESDYGYSFYLLFDIANGRAVWGKTAPLDCTSCGSSSGGVTTPPTNGVYILDSDRYYHTSEEWDTVNNYKAVGVAVITDECSFVIGKTTPTYNYDGFTNIARLEIDGIVRTMFYSTAQLDYAGENNSLLIRQADPTGNSSNNVAYLCYEHTISVKSVKNTDI